MDSKEPSSLRVKGNICSFPTLRIDIDTGALGRLLCFVGQWQLKAF